MILQADGQQYNPIKVNLSFPSVDVDVTGKNREVSNTNREKPGREIRDAALGGSTGEKGGRRKEGRERKSVGWEQ